MEADRDKARAFLTHLAVASEKFSERQISRGRLAEQLKKLRTIDVKEMEQHIKELERRIADALNKERRILKVLRHEYRLGHAAPEEKSVPADDPKKNIRKNLAMLEKTYDTLKKERYPKEQLERIEKKIQGLKEKL